MISEEHGDTEQQANLGSICKMLDYISEELIANGLHKEAGDILRSLNSLREKCDRPIRPLLN